MIDPGALVADLKQQVLALEADLRERIALPQFADEWKREHAQAIEKKRTAATYTAWAVDRITQVAVSWVLTTVFVRFCEDNRLLAPVWIAGPAERRQEALDAQLAYFRTNPEHTDREWVEQAIEHLAATPATAGLVDDQAMLHSVSPSGQAVTQLLEFWRRTDDGGRLVHDFTDATLDTRFLGDLYQDLSDHAKKTFALLQTPEFVEEFILDRTLTPALADRPLECFKLIDPACGSGHFLLGAFRRLLERWDAEAPALGPRERVQKSLDAVWGVDVNAFAVAIAIFRLTIEALRWSSSARGPSGRVQTTSLENAPRFRIHVLVGDSLWFSHDQTTLPGTVDDDFAYSNEHRTALQAALTRGQYDAVVANPPYITVKDKALNEGYRERYNHLKGTYALSVPFMELLFKLSKRDSETTAAGWVGQITSNSFMKREFGAPIIEDFLAQLDLREVIDTSGAYIPGHGTPTVVIVGRNQSPSRAKVRAILGIRGEPGRPDLPAHALVWSSIRENVDAGAYEDTWITVTALDRMTLAIHPWSLTGGGADSVIDSMQAALGARLRTHIQGRIGFASFPGADDAFLASREALIRSGIAKPQARALITGDVVRDWAIGEGDCAFAPYQSDLTLIELDPRAAWYRRQWPLRTTLGGTVSFDGKTQAVLGQSWWGWYRWVPERYRTSLTVTFAFVATHNHFVLDRGGKVFKQSAPVIKLSAEASEDDYLKLLGVLNSSTACFWLKQNSHDKGNGGYGGGIASTEWERFYEFTGTTLQDFPLPKSLPLERSRILDGLAQALSAQQVSTLIEGAATAEMIRSAEANQTSLRGRMIAHQEELDWEVYRLYRLMPDALTYAGEPPEVKLGERAFEIVLARRVTAGEEEETSWFERHGSTPITEIPEHWPADYRSLVQGRIDAIESIDAIRLLEAPEYKRRWASEPFDKQTDKALRGWLLDRLEGRTLWENRSGQVTPRSISQLADRLGRDEEFRGVVELWQGHRDIDLVKALTSLLESEAVPYLAAHRLKDTGLRKFVDWKRTWELQRQEDRIRAEELRGFDTLASLPAQPADALTSLPAQPADALTSLPAQPADALARSSRTARPAADRPKTPRADAFAATIPVPPKYTSADFRKPAYWSARGKLDVPKERFILYPGGGRETDPTPLLGWAGWDHAKQALALATIIDDRQREGAASETLVPLVAGLAELQPWVDQWHAHIDPTYGVSLAAVTAEALRAHLLSLGVTHDDLTRWRPTLTTRGRRPKK